MRTPARTTVAISLKMYFSHARTLDYCRALAALAAADEGVQTGATDLVVLPTFVAIPAALAAVHGTRMLVGAQDLAAEDSGAYTGEVSGAELAEIGCTHVVVGHAERRTEFGETEAVVAAKTRAAFRNGLVPILCVGEPARADPAAAADVCVRQVRSAVPDRGAAAAVPRMIVAYEPYWAIGASQPASTTYAGGDLGGCRDGDAGIGAALEVVGRDAEVLDAGDVGVLLKVRRGSRPSSRNRRRRCRRGVAGPGAWGSFR